ncbi:MAG TPA: VirB4 family type IV secretion system protein [Sphingomonas sp.]|nr:VirB4 family type IV secretion system protein [Sphingomonas sp.]
MSERYATLGAGRLRPREASIGSRLPYAQHLDEAAIATRDGRLIAVIRLDGFPFETMDDEELAYRKTVRETLLRGAAGSRLALYHHVIRRETTPAWAEVKGDPFCERLDEAWRARLETRRLFVNDLFLTLVRRPLQGRAGFAERLFRRAAGRAPDLDEELRQLRATTETFLAALAPYGARLLTTYEGEYGFCSEPAGFLAALAGRGMAPLLLPEGPIAEAIADRRLTFGLDAMEFGPGGGDPARYGAIVSLKDYPARSRPGMLDGVLRLPFELTMTESFAFVDRQVTLERMGRSLRRLRAAGDDAFSLREELAQARDQVGAGRAAYGEHHLTVLVKADDLGQLDGAVAEVQSSLAERGAVAVREDVNLEPAFWAQFPGKLDHVARHALISTANFASFASFHNHPVGRAQGNHWGPAVTVFETTAFGPYHFNFHVGDFGNFTVIGPSGSGKTVLLTFLAAQARKFGPRIVYFDKDRGAEIFVRACGGRYDVLRPGQPTGLNPLLLPDSRENRIFLAEWLALLLRGEGAPLDVEDQALVADAIDANFAAPRAHRRLRHLRELLRGARRPSAGDLAARLDRWCEDGEHGWLFDNEEDRLALDAGVTGFDMTRILDTPVTRTPAMLALFHRIEQSLDGAPAMVIVDEGWKALDDDVFIRRLKDWQKTIRKKNGIVGFCTQSAADALDSRIAATIVEQAATRIFFPNRQASAADYCDGFGLSAHELELVRTLPEGSRCFLVKQADHSVVARLDLTGLESELKVLAGTERSVRRLDAIRAESGDDPAQWLPLVTGQPFAQAAE